MDEHLRRLERRYAQTGAARDRGALLLARGRVNPGLLRVYYLASLLGLPAAMIAYPEPYLLPLGPGEFQVDRDLTGLSVRDLPAGLGQIAPGYESWIMNYLGVKVVSLALEQHRVSVPRKITRLLGLLSIPSPPEVIAQHLYSKIVRDLVIQARICTAEFLIGLGRLPILRPED